MTNTYNRKRRHYKNQFNPLENIINELMNTPVNKIINQNNVHKSNPPSNVIETNEHFQIDLMAPGVKKENIEIKIENNNLIISSIIDKEFDKGQKVEYRLKEFNSNQIERTFALPNNVMKDQLQASFSNGILKIKAPKNPNSTRKINVK